ncbi:hypothetical protein I316_07239 [Kwoniella heveanensis BCC8398]|uniref:Uncharacterized protein n=1 Tax=Kwoniella heveanensis BCC8398 TaxID=1296120 RepID=A0A1B9GJC7_9TREE|nr:hypothetical protein I316_07239 [Kwoniella heveanensis BCC8398]
MARFSRDGQTIAMDSTGHYQIPASGPTSPSTSTYPFHNTGAPPYQSPFEADTSSHTDPSSNLHHSQSQTFYPNPDPDSDTLVCPPSPESSHLPSLQVTHPTPTKPIKYRRQSASTLSISTAGSFDPSPLAQSQLLPSPASGTDALEVMVDPSPRSRPRSPEEDSDAEREREKQAEKQARIREKGRERQRRKRERDKKAKEANTSVSTVPLTTATHLPVPPSKSSTTPHMLSISVPSSASSIASSLPQSASYFSISPGQHTFGFTGSTSASGASTPGTLFSPAATTPSYSPDTALNTAFFGIGLEGVAVPTGPLEMGEKSRKSSRGKARAATTSVSSAKVPPVNTTTSPPPPQVKSAKPAKRRKSEPQTDEITGLGMIGTDVLQSLTEDRPKPRRTASDGVVIKSSFHERDWARSPTPPPVPTLPSEYRRDSERSMLADIDGITPSAQAETFASRAIYLLNKDEDETGWLRDQIGCDAKGLEGMKAALASLYDRWLLEQGMKDMTLESHESSGMTGITTHRSMPASPITSSTSFFTPSSSRHRPTTANGHVQESPLASTQTHSHTRQRSLSSASMLARGLHINPQMLMTSTTQQQWTQPATPTSSSQQSAVEPRSDGTASPSLQTPSTGQGSFPLLPEQMPCQGHGRSATDPSGRRTYTTVQPQAQTPTHNMSQIDWTQVPNTCPPAGIVLDSPLSMAAQIKNGCMPPPPQVPMPNVGVPLDAANAQVISAHLPPHDHASLQAHAQPGPQPSYHQRHFSTPVTTRTGSVRAVVPVPYTPPTPVPMRGQNHTLHNGSSTIPVWYNSAFMPGSGQLELGSPGPGQGNGEGGVFALEQMYLSQSAHGTDFPTG